jgi:hypothetical protein
MDGSANRDSSVRVEKPRHRIRFDTTQGKRQEGIVMNEDIEDIAANWLFLDDRKKEKEIKQVLADPQVKLPLAYVDKRRRVFFNESAKKFERIEEIENKIRELEALAGKPLMILLTRSLKELVEIAPDTRVTAIEGIKPKEDFK